MDTCVFLTDLDDTLFHSMKKQNASANLVQATTAKNGHHSFMNAKQVAILNWMRNSGPVIPVTARSSEAFSRVHLDFGTKRAVLSNGAVILNENGDPDIAWIERTRDIGEAASLTMHAMSATIHEEFGEGARSWVVQEYGSPIYFCVKMNLDDPEKVEEGIGQAFSLLFERFGTEGFHTHRNGNNLSFIPNGISKRDACIHLLETLGLDIPVIGVGDSLTDLPFMGLCDFMMVPGGSQISRRFLPATLRLENDNV